MKSGFRTPLEGIRVIDLSQAAAGPLCGQHLAALGAEVIKVERPGSGDMARQTPPYAGASGVVPVRERSDDVATTVLKRNRNKQGLSLNLQDPTGVELLRQLAAQSDVVLENYRPGVMERLGLSHEQLRTVKPELIYCSITGFGRDGPYKDWAAFDPIIQAMSGLMALTGFPGSPPTKTGIIIGDQIAPLFAVTAILAALRVRDLTGEGQLIEVSMLDCLLSLVWDEPIEYLAQLGSAVRVGNQLLRMAPWNSYRVLDGSVVICVAHAGQWHRLTEVMGRPDLATDPRFESVELRLANVKALDAEIGRWSSGRTRHEVVSACQTMGIPCGPVNELSDLLDDPHISQRGLLKPLPHPTQGKVNSALASDYPVRFSSFTASLEQPAPMLGQHNHQILSELLGLSDDDVRQLASRGVI
jgi:formyl-CoA transferase